MRQSMDKRRKKTQSRITAGDLRVLLCAFIFFAAVILKYADFGAAKTVRAQAAHLLHGGVGAEEVLEVFGKFTQDGGLQSVFAENEKLAQVFGFQDAKEEETEPTENTDTSNAELAVQADEVVTTDADMQAEGGYSEDLEDRQDSIFPKTADETAYMMSFTHIKPLKEAVLTSDFGNRVHPITGVKSFHFGLDLAADEGTSIRAMADGTVRQVGDGSYGNYVIVDHADGFATLYAHCSKILVKQNEDVTAGQSIALVGATGNATGNHLHLEVWRDGKALDPGNYVQYTTTQ